jgi:hypothetical protein
MRASIVVEDNIVVVDGVIKTTDCAMLLGDGISAVQWEDTSGHIEYVGHAKPNEAITDFAPYQHYVDDAQPLPPPSPELAPPPEPIEPVVIKLPPIPTPADQFLLDHENRLLALEGKPPMSFDEYVAIMQKKTETYNAVVQAAISAAQKGQVSHAAADPAASGRAAQR